MGTSTSASGSAPPPSARIRCRMGSAKAAVLPVPVAACPTRSRPSSRGGIAASWIGVGSSYPRPESARHSSGASMRSAKPVASSPLPSVTNEPSCSTSTFSTPTLVSALGRAIGARPGLGLIQRGGDFAVTCYVAVKALTSSSAAVAADCRGDGHDAGRLHRWVGPRLTIVHSISELGAQKTTTTSGYSPSGRQFIPAPAGRRSAAAARLRSGRRAWRLRGRSGPA